MGFDVLFALYAALHGEEYLETCMEICEFWGIGWFYRGAHYEW